MSSKCGVSGGVSRAPQPGMPVDLKLRCRSEEEVGMEPQFLCLSISKERMPDTFIFSQNDGVFL